MLLGSIGREGSIFNHLQQKLGIVTAVHMPFSGCGRYTAYVSINKKQEGHPKMVGLQALAHVPGLFTVVVVDDDIDVFNEEDVLWAISTYVDPSRDVDLLKNVAPASDPRGIGSGRLIIDATKPTHVAFATRLKVPDEALSRIKLEEWLDSVEGGGKP